MRHKLFDFLDDEYYKLMLDMSKEMHDKIRKVIRRMEWGVVQRLV